MEIYNLFGEDDFDKSKAVLSIYLTNFCSDKYGSEEDMDILLEEIENELGEMPKVTFTQVERKSDDFYTDDWNAWDEIEKADDDFEVEYELHFLKVSDYDAVAKIIKEHCLDGKRFTYANKDFDFSKIKPLSHDEWKDLLERAKKLGDDENLE